MSALVREWRMGIDTAQLVEVDELGHGADCIGYEPISYECFDRAMRQVHVHADDVFLDYGCGKGRAVIRAAMHPFKRVVGVELSQTLCTMAEEQVRRARRRLVCDDIEIINADASSCRVPDDVTMIFLWNPFTGAILDSALDRVHDSLVRAPRQLTLIYALPYQDTDPLAACGWLRKSRAVESQFFTGVKTTIYESRNRGTAAVGLRRAIRVDDRNMAAGSR